VKSYKAFVRNTVRSLHLFLTQGKTGSAGTGGAGGRKGLLSIEGVVWERLNELGGIAGNVGQIKRRQGNAERKPDTGRPGRKIMRSTKVGPSARQRKNHVVAESTHGGKGTRFMSAASRRNRREKSRFPKGGKFPGKKSPVKREKESAPRRKGRGPSRGARRHRERPENATGKRWSPALSGVQLLLAGGPTDGGGGGERKKGREN